MSATTEFADRSVQIGHHRFLVQACAEMRTASVRRACEKLRDSAEQLKAGGDRVAGVETAELLPLMVVPYLSPSVDRACEAHHLSRLDLSGNANISGRNLRIRCHGYPNKFATRGRPASAFAPKSARVASALLQDPSRTWTQRCLTQETDLGQGFVSRILRRLVDDDLVERDGSAYGVKSPELLLRTWAEEYRFEGHMMYAGSVPARHGLELTLSLSEQLASEGVAHAFTGLAAAWRYAPHARYRNNAVYLDRVPSESLLQRLGFEHDAQGGNTWLLVPKDRELVERHTELVEGVRCVCPVRTWLDLQHTPERSGEAAGHLAAERMPWALDAAD